MEATLTQALEAPDESSLADRFRGGDAEAFAAIVTLHRRTVYGVARRLLRSHEDADEAAQVAFVKAWNARSRFRGAARLKTWLVSIVLNVSKSMLAARREMSVLPDEPGVPDRSADPGVGLDRLRRRRELRRAVESLPPRQQEVVLLKVYQDLTYREVAAILDLTEGAVKAHLHQAVSNLRRGLTREAPEEQA